MSEYKASNYSHSPGFPALLAELQCSLLVTTYQAGQLCSFGTTGEGKLHIALDSFSVAMGIALHPRKIAVGSRGFIWFLESAAFPGYTRGLGFAGPFAFVGLSRIRETSVFGGLPIAERCDELKCGVGVVDLRSGQQLAAFQFLDAVEEIFDVRVLPGVRCPVIRGPQPRDQDQDEIWVAPPPRAELEAR